MSLERVYDYINKYKRFYHLYDWVKELTYALENKEDIIISHKIFNALYNTSFTDRFQLDTDYKFIKREFIKFAIKYKIKFEIKKLSIIGDIHPCNEYIYISIDNFKKFLKLFRNVKFNKYFYMIEKVINLK